MVVLVVVVVVVVVVVEAVVVAVTVVACVAVAIAVTVAVAVAVLIRCAKLPHKHNNVSYRQTAYFTDYRSPLYYIPCLTTISGLGFVLLPH